MFGDRENLKHAENGGLLEAQFYSKLDFAAFSRAGDPSEILGRRIFGEDFHAAGPGQIKVRVVEQVEELRAKLHGGIFAGPAGAGALGEREVDIAQRRPGNRIPSQITEKPRLRPQEGGGVDPLAKVARVRIARAGSGIGPLARAPVTPRRTVAGRPEAWVMIEATRQPPSSARPAPERGEGSSQELLRARLWRTSWPERPRL